MKTDIEIARSIALEPIEKIAAKVAIPTDHLEHYGKYLAKVDLSELVISLASSSSSPPSPLRRQVSARRRSLSASLSV